MRQPDASSDSPYMLGSRYGHQWRVNTLQVNPLPFRSRAFAAGIQRATQECHLGRETHCFAGGRHAE